MWKDFSVNFRITDITQRGRKHIMLVEYQVANFGPYKQPISLNMKSTDDDSFCARIPRFESPYHMSVNPVAAIYEAYSAAGKIHLRQQVEDQKEHAI